MATPGQPPPRPFSLQPRRHFLATRSGVFFPPVGGRVSGGTYSVPGGTYVRGGVPKAGGNVPRGGFGGGTRVSGSSGG